MAPAWARRPGAIRIDDPWSKISRGVPVFGEPRFFGLNPRVFGTDARFFGPDRFFGTDPRFFGPDRLFGADIRLFGDPPDAGGCGVTRLLRPRR